VRRFAIEDEELERGGADSLASITMGQPVAVVEKQSATPGIVRFEANRSLTGMGHERFAGQVDAYDVTPSAELARRLFATGRVDNVHVYANVITVDLRKGFNSDGLSSVIEGLYTYWTPGKVPPSPEELIAETPGAAGGDAPSAGAPGGAGTAVDSRIPAALLERSRAALAKWKATHPAE
jgi:hypothetical protein